MIYIALYIVLPLLSWFALVSLIPIVLINYDDVKDLEVILVYDGGCGLPMSNARLAIQ